MRGIRWRWRVELEGIRPRVEGIGFRSPEERETAGAGGQRRLSMMEGRSDVDRRTHLGRSVLSEGVVDANELLIGGGGVGVGELKRSLESLDLVL